MIRKRWRAAASAAMLLLAGCVATPSPEAASSFQSGKASWYGPGFHGRRTASGESYNMNGYSAAHRSYPFGTRLCVHNLNNDRKVAVRVNDRGPFVRGRVVDVSRGAAQSLGMIRSGTAPVKVSVIKGERKSGGGC